MHPKQTTCGLRHLSPYLWLIVDDQTELDMFRVQGEVGGLRPVLREEMQDCLPRDVRLQEKLQDENKLRGGRTAIQSGILKSFFGQLFVISLSD